MRSKYSTQDKNLAAIQESIKSMMEIGFSRVLKGQEYLTKGNTAYSVTPDTVAGVLKMRADLYTLQGGGTPLVEKTYLDLLARLQDGVRQKMIDNAEAEFYSVGYAGLANSRSMVTESIYSSVEEDYPVRGIGDLGQYAGNDNFPKLIPLLRGVDVDEISEVLYDFYDYFHNIFMKSGDGIHHVITIEAHHAPLKNGQFAITMEVSLSFEGKNVPSKFKKPVSLTKEAGIPSQIVIRPDKEEKLLKYFHAIADLFV
jgi:hypothetical protein